MWFKSPGNSVKMIYVKCQEYVICQEYKVNDDKNVKMAINETRKTRKSSASELLVTNWKKWNIIPNKDKNEINPSIKKTQFPLMLSRTSTVHKIHGISITEDAIRFNLQPQKSNNQRKKYLALSWIRNMEKYFL